jgi:hypothetical protein
MAALTLANMLSRVKRNVPSTTMDTELQDALLEKMTYLVSLDTFPFQEKYVNDTLAAGAVSIVTPDNFASIRSMVIYTAGSERPLNIISAEVFDKLYPNPSEETADEPTDCCIKVAEGYFYFNCPADADYTLRCYFYAIPDDVTDTTVSQLIELAKITVIEWASAQGFRQLGQYDRAKEHDDEGNKNFAAIEKRYALSREADARMISQKEMSVRYRGK